MQLGRYQTTKLTMAKTTYNPAWRLVSTLDVVKYSSSYGQSRPIFATPMIFVDVYTPRMQTE